MSEEQENYQLTVLGGDVRKADTKALITNGTEAFPEDSFVGSYWSADGTGVGVAILEPQYLPGTLYALATQNNMLLQCVEAMEVNIDGTGHSIQLREGEVEDKEEFTRLNDFFKEPYPGKSMINIRREFRRDLETTGNAYMEVIRSAKDEVVMLNSIEGTEVRLVRLDEPVTVPKTLKRGGKDMKVMVRTRERRYVQLINGKKTYFKEFGASRDLDRETGEWAKGGKRIPLERRASEIIHNIGNKEPKTPYGTPRWINQLPSVLGSRKAEEYNLEFFDGGGLPPVLVIVQGGTLGAEVKADLRNHLSGKGGRHRAAVVEAISTSGSIDSSGSVQVRVERFGGDRMKDALFQEYDAGCAEKVRMAFRLPTLFIGNSRDMTFATAYTSYLVAEAQVFFPERDEFDSIMNTKILPELGATKYVFRSLPMTMVDIQNQLKAIELVSGNQMLEGSHLVETLNEITGLSMEYTKPPEPLAMPPQGEGTLPRQPVEPKVPVEPGGSPQDVGTGKKPPYSHTKKSEVVNLASRWTELMNQGATTLEMDLVRKAVTALSQEDTALFGQIVASQRLPATGHSITDMAELCACADELTIGDGEAA